jgi:hypothetical protein
MKTAQFSIQTPAGVGGAVAVVQVFAANPEALDAVLARIGVGSIAVGRVVLRDLLGVDRGLVARWHENSVHLMPHGGPGVMRALAGRLCDAGLSSCGAGDAAAYPEARTHVEARMLAVMARAASPLAIDLLLHQPERWQRQPARAETDRDRILRRLIDPPLVVALGPPNVGKSTLVNALAGRSVSIVADEPGTTRDHVGVMLNLAGLVVRYVDTPGMNDAPSNAIEAEAREIARRTALGADLVLLAGDVTAAPVGFGFVSGVERIVIALRLDLGTPPWPFDAGVSVHEGRGVDGLVRLVRDRLVPPAFLADHAPWRFWAEPVPSD